MSLEGNKAIVRRHLEEGWSEGNLAVMDEIVAPTAIHDYYRHYPPGPEGFKEAIIGPRTTFPDLRLTIHEMIAEGDMVVTRYTWHGTDRGGFPGAQPTGTQIEITGMDMDRLTNGQIILHWTIIDELALRQRLGLVRLPE